jgi:hypothetical protein
LKSASGRIEEEEENDLYRITASLSDNLAAGLKVCLFSSHVAFATKVN